MTMTKDQLAAHRLQLIAELNAIGQAPIDTPEGRRREEVIADLRNTNEAIKQLNIDEARRAKSAADRKKARGMAEHFANLQRAGVPPEALAPPAPPPTPTRPQQTPGEFVLWSATKLRKLLRRFATPAPHTVAFLPLLSKFIDEQAAFLRAETQAREAASTPSDWRETWLDDAQHHGRDDMACPACGTDSTTGCISGAP